MAETQRLFIRSSVGLTLRASAVSLGYLLSCALIATILAFPVYQLTNGFIGMRAVVSRGSLLLVILGLLPWSLFLRLTRADVGVTPTGGRRAFLTGLALGILMLGLHSGLLIIIGVRVAPVSHWPEITHLLSALLKALGVGVLVAMLEEILFRGVMLAALQRTAGSIAAVLLSSAYYALLHFFRPDYRLDINETGWLSGFAYLTNALQHVFAAPVDSLLALFFAGVLLALVRLRFSCGLIYCVGLHAGWVFVIKFVKPLTEVVPDGEWSFMVGGYDGFTGYLAAGWMAVLSLMVWTGIYRQGQRDNAVIQNTLDID